MKKNNFYEKMVELWIKHKLVVGQEIKEYKNIEIPQEKIAKEGRWKKVKKDKPSFGSQRGLF